MKLKKYKSHADVDKSYKWDLSFLLDGKSIDEQLEIVYKGFESNIIAWKDKQYESPENYLLAQESAKSWALKFFKVSNYVSNHLSQNLKDVEANKLFQTFSAKMALLQKELGSQENRAYENIDKLKLWVNREDFKLHKSDLEAFIESETHRLPKEISEYHVATMWFEPSLDEIFSVLNDVELKFKKAVGTDKKEYDVSSATMGILTSHPDANVRKTASQSFSAGYLSLKDTFSMVLFQHLKQASADHKLRKFNSTVEQLIFSDRADDKLLKVMQSEISAHKDTFKPYFSWFKKFYEEKTNLEFSRYDYNFELISEDNEYDISDMQKIVLASIKPFGAEYEKVAKSALLDENWVDYFAVENKRSGAYSIGATYGIDKKLILMNFDGKLRSVETLAHELGHSMHSYFSDKTQPFEKSQYSIFVAEIASIFNELMLYDHLLKNSDDDKFKFSILNSMIKGFHATVIRQMIFSNYEYDIYSKIDQNIPLSSFDDFAKLYLDSYKKYSVRDEVLTNDDAIGAIYVPHYYYDFYVYKYAIGQLVASIFFARYKKDGIESLKTYIDSFLSSGSSLWPLDLLKQAGVNLYEKETYKEAFKNMDSLISDWVTLGRKIFNI